MNEDIRKIIDKVKNVPSINEDVSKDDYIRAYTNRINKERDDLLLKVQTNPNFNFVLGVDMEFIIYGKPNKCETNVYTFIKEKLSDGEKNYFPVGGFYFTSQTLFPVEHWWVYDSATKSHIEITPLGNEKPWCYGGVINFEINAEILNSNQVFDVDFFKGGNVYSRYFK